MALRHFKRTAGELTHDGQTLRIAQREKHVGQPQVVAAGMGQVGVFIRHGSNLVEPWAE